MGQKDLHSKMFFSDNRHFAELVNYFLFGGEKIIMPERLRDESVLEHGHSRGRLTERERDIIKSVIPQGLMVKMLILGIEPESNVNYGEHVKLCSYDMRRYEKQISEIQALKNKASMSGNEFISGIGRDDKLIPVITIAIYMGNKKWDGPRKLSDMFDRNDISQRVMKYINDYSINLIIPEEMNDEDIESFSIDLRALFGFIKHSGSKKELLAYIDNNTKLLDNIDIKTYEAINEFTGNRLPEYKEKGGKVEMCRGIEELIADSKIEGKAEGKSEGKAEAERIMVQRLLANKVDINVIIAACDVLSSEEVHKIAGK